MRSFLHGAASTKTLAKLQRSSSKMAYTFRPGDLPKLDLQVDRGTDFKAWKTQWEAYHSLSGLSTQNQQKQVQALTLCFTRETLTIVENLGLTREQRGSVADIVTAIQSYVEGQINESVERRHFRQRKQQHGETFDDFLVSLRELAKTCNFCSDECTQKGIRDQIVEGLLDGDTVEDLLKEADLTLQTTVSKCRAQEAAKQQRAEITSTPIGHTAVQAVRRNPSARQQQPLTGTCPGCGSPHHQGGRQQCPAFCATCRSCGKAGHFARVCRSRGPQPAPPTNQPTASPDPQHPPTANPVSDPETGDLLAENMATCAEVRALTSCTQESLRLTDLRQQAEGDHEYQQLKKYIYEGFPPHRNQLLEQCRRYWNLRNQLTIEDDLIVYGCRLLIPSAMRHSVLVQLHSAHQGSVRTRQRAKQVVYWPGIDNDIDNIILQCKQCQETLPSQPREPLIAKPRPTRPFQEIAIDFCTYGGQQFLILIDCYTDWPEIIQMGQNTTTSHLIAVLLDAFGRHGVPDVIWSDQGPQFMSHMFSGFAQEWGFQHITSSPTYPQSNGKAESAVKSMKKIIEGAWARNHMNAEKLVRALLQYRNTPSRRDGLSPAQKLFGQPIQDTLPAHHSAFAPQWQQGPIEDNSSSHEDYYNQHAQTLPEIAIGTNVAIQNDTTKRWDIYGVVTEVGPFRRYHVKTSTGRVLVRNRRYIRRRVPVVPPTVQNIPNPPIRINLDPPAIPRRSARQHRRPLRYIEEFAS